MCGSSHHDDRLCVVVRAFTEYFEYGTGIDFLPTALLDAFDGQLDEVTIHSGCPLHAQLDVRKQVRKAK